MDRVREIAASKEDHFKTLAVDELRQEYGLDIIQTTILANVFHQINNFIVTEITLPNMRNTLLPHFTALAVKLINELDKAVTFQDHRYLGLPMDNSADDILVPVMHVD